MAGANLEQLMQSVEDPVAQFRANDYEHPMYVFPDEYTNWIEEQRAVQDTCILVDQSHHMSPLYLKGPGALDVLSDLSTNSVEEFRTESPPKAKNIVFCNHDGYMIRDVIMFYLEDQTFVSAGTEIPNHWLEYHLETGDYDVTHERPYTPNNEAIPKEFRFQIQGPHARQVLEAVTDGTFPDIGFFEMDLISLNDIDTWALGHGMAGSPGWEIFGPYKYHDEIKEAILNSGDEYGMRQMGSKAYKTGKIASGWIHQPVPAIYQSEEMRQYREWLSPNGPEAKMSIGGSFVSDDIRDYYLDPIECGQAHLIDLDHDFIGKEALKQRSADPSRERVTFVWNEDDVVEVYASLFNEGNTFKYIDLPDTARQWSLTQYDRVEKNGEVVGISKYPGYLSYEREMLSLGVIDQSYAEPGTDVTLIWGEEPSKKQMVERHVEFEINVTVARSPFVDSGRRGI